MTEPADGLIGERFHAGDQYGDITGGTYLKTYFHGDTQATNKQVASTLPGTADRDYRPIQVQPGTGRLLIYDIDISAVSANTVYVGAGSTAAGRLIWKQWVPATGGVARTFSAAHLCPAGARLWAKTSGASSVSIFVRGRLTT